MISRYDNCLFIHIPKVAGQSIESVFLKRAGLTWQQREEMLLKPNKLPSMGPPRLAHLTALEYVKHGYLSANEFSEIFKFSFVRNPWERLVSEYKYRNFTFSFKDFVWSKFPLPSDDNYSQGVDLYRHIIPQSDFLYDQHDNLLVDYVGKFESLANDFSRVTKLITGDSLSLPHKNKSSKTLFEKLASWRGNKGKHYSEYYDDATREYIEDLYKRDIRLLDYTFEQV